MAISKALRYQILRRDNHTCQACGRTAPEVKLQVDHVIPEALGGQTVPENLRTLCADCNGGKSATPPDAAQVAAVSADAARWAEAMKVAAAGALADAKARAAIYRKFDKAWKSWPETERPAGWKQSVDSFIAAGLPIEVLTDCVDRAMGNPKIRPWDVFRYMCGIAWSRVTEMQEAASAVVAPPTAPPMEAVTAEMLSPCEADKIAIPAYDQGRRELADEILFRLSPTKVGALIAEQFDAAVEEGDELDRERDMRGAYLYGRAAVAAFDATRESLDCVSIAVEDLIDGLPPVVHSWVKEHSVDPAGHAYRLLAGVQSGTLSVTLMGVAV